MGIRALSHDPHYPSIIYITYAHSSTLTGNDSFIIRAKIDDENFKLLPPVQGAFITTFSPDGTQFTTLEGGEGSLTVAVRDFKFPISKLFPAIFSFAPRAANSFPGNFASVAWTSDSAWLAILGSDGVFLVAPKHDFIHFLPKPSAGSSCRDLAWIE